MTTNHSARRHGRDQELCFTSQGNTAIGLIAIAPPRWYDPTIGQFLNEDPNPAGTFAGSVTSLL